MKLKCVVLLTIFLSSVLLSKNLSLLERFDPECRELLDVEISGNLMIIPGNLEGVEFYDISNPSQPVQIQNYRIPQFPHNFYAAASSDYCYISSRESGIAILDISNPGNAYKVGAFQWSEDVTYEGLHIQGDTLAVTIHEAGILFLDITDPVNPIVISQLQSDNAWTVKLQGNIAYIADGEDGISIVDITDLNNPMVIGEHTTTGTTRDLALDGDFLYVAVGSGGVNLFDVSDPENVQLLDVYDTSGLANAVGISNGKVVVSDWIDLKILQWNGTELELVGFKSTGKRTISNHAAGDIIYSAEWRFLQVFDFGEIDAPDLDLSTYEITFPQLEIGESDTSLLTFTNNGLEQLVINSSFFTHTDFSMANEPNVIESGDSVNMDVIYTKSDENASGTLRIFSNDPDESQINCLTVGNYEGANEGEVAADFELNVVANGEGTFRLSDHLGKIVIIAFFAPG